MISVQNLTKHYGPRLALQDVSFHVDKGEVLGFLGPNGAGKTTTMRILTGYLPPSSGTARVAGFDVTRQSLEARQHIGYLPETVPLYTDMPVREYLDFMAKIKGVPRDRRRRRVDASIEAARLSDVANVLIGKLSKGYRQRVGLAQAILAEPDVLILDEPTVGLDPKQIIETRALIKELGKDHTIILSTHILPEVSMTCSRVIIINEGRIVAVDRPGNLEKRLRGSETIQMEVRGPQQAVLDRLRKVPKVISVTANQGGKESHVFQVECELGSDVRERLAEAVVTGGWGLLELRPVGMSLEEIFLKLTTSEEA